MSITDAEDITVTVDADCTAPSTAGAANSSGTGDDSLYGNTQNDTLWGGPGEDTIDG